MHSSRLFSFCLFFFSASSSVAGTVSFESLSTQFNSDAEYQPQTGFFVSSTQRAPEIATATAGSGTNPISQGDATSVHAARAGSGDLGLRLNSFDDILSVGMIEHFTFGAGVETAERLELNYRLDGSFLGGNSTSGNEGRLNVISRVRSENAQFDDIGLQLSGAETQIIFGSDMPDAFGREFGVQSRTSSLALLGKDGDSFDFEFTVEIVLNGASDLLYGFELQASQSPGIVFCGVGCPFNNGLTNDDMVTVDFLNTLTLQEVTAFDASDMELPDLEIFGSVSGDTVIQRNNIETPVPGGSSDLSAVPLPASGWMLIASLFGMGALRRYQRA